MSIPLGRDSNQVSHLMHLHGDSDKSNEGTEEEGDMQSNHDSKRNEKGHSFTFTLGSKGSEHWTMGQGEKIEGVQIISTSLKSQISRICEPTTKIQGGQPKWGKGWGERKLKREET